MTIYGYARVSTDGQTLDAQIAALKAAGAMKVFSEKQSGAKTDRAALAKALAVLSAGDVLVVTRLDRLARSTRDLLNVLATVSEGGAGFRSLGDPWADTTTPHGRLMLTVLGGLAEFERSLILTRTGEGRARAMARGVRFGRKLVDFDLIREGGSNDYTRAVEDEGVFTMPWSAMITYRRICSSLSSFSSSPLRSRQKSLNLFASAPCRQRCW